LKNWHSRHPEWSVMLYNSRTNKGTPMNKNLPLLVKTQDGYDVCYHNGDYWDSIDSFKTIEDVYAAGWKELQIVTEEELQ
jgi:hypothetical protein